MNSASSKPPSSSLTTDDLFAEVNEGRRLSIGREEMDRAIEYEQSLLPSNTQFPQTGQIYEALVDVPVRFIVSFSAPVSDGGEGNLLKGERIVIRHLSPEVKPLFVVAAPLQPDIVEHRLVPEHTRNETAYGGFSLHLKTVELNRHFMLVGRE